MEECVEKPINLAYDVYDVEDDDLFINMLSPVVIFHAAFDNKGNWANIAKEIAEKTVRKVYVLDMRDHGDSPKPSNMCHELNVKDLENFLLKINRPAVVIGHSLGGTAAIDLSFRKPHLVKELILIDISPLRYPESEEKVGLKFCSLMKQLITDIPNDINLYEAQSHVQNQVKHIIKNCGLQKVIISNLKKDVDGWKWKANIPRIEYLGHIRAMRKVYPIRGSFHGRTLLVHSSSSDYVIPKLDYAALKVIFPEIKIKCFEQCSHQIHLDKPKELLEVIIQFLNEK